jgi:xylulokinase
VSTADAAIVVTLDIGGSAAKASGYDAARQESLGSTAAPYPARPAGQDMGMFDPDQWWTAAVGALRDLRQLIGQPASRYLGITVSAIRIPFVLLDRCGHAVMPGLLNRDLRAVTQAGQIAAAIGGGELYRTTGHWPAPQFGLPKILWVRENHPDAWRATRTVLQLHDWFIYRLSGVLASERSSAAMSQLMDARTGNWAAGLLAGLDIPAALLPELRAAGTPAGGLLPAVAEATGFAAGTPVHIGGGDTHMSALSARHPLLDPPGEPRPVVVAGTTAPAMLAVPGDRLPRDPGDLFPLLLSTHVVPGMSALETNAGPTGMIAGLLAGLRGTPGGGLRPVLEQRGLTVAGAADADVADEPVVLAGNPFFEPDSWASMPPPAVIGLRDQHSGSALYQASLLGTCYAIRSILDCLMQRSAISRIRPGPVVATGGMSRNMWWAQTLADVTGRSVTVPSLDLTAGRAGALIVTGNAATAAADAAAGTRTFAPNPDRAPVHSVGLARYRDLYQATRLCDQPKLVTRAGTR